MKTRPPTTNEIQAWVKARCRETLFVIEKIKENDPKLENEVTRRLLAKERGRLEAFRKFAAYAANGELV